LAWNVHGYTQQKARLQHEYREGWRQQMWDAYNTKHGQNGKSIGDYCPKYYAASAELHEEGHGGVHDQRRTYCEVESAA
jgi:hypothetical protein